jgi:hypothetical protein
MRKPNVNVGINAGLFMPMGNLEDGLPGTGKKMAGAAIFLCGGVAGGITAIVADPAIGGIVILGSLVVGMAITGWGMYENYQENKKLRELQKENLTKHNAYLDKLTNNLPTQEQNINNNSNINNKVNANLNDNNISNNLIPK